MRKIKLLVVSSFLALTASAQGYYNPYNTYNNAYNNPYGGFGSNTYISNTTIVNSSQQHYTANDVLVDAVSGLIVNAIQRRNRRNCNTQVNYYQNYNQSSCNNNRQKKRRRRNRWSW